MTENRSQESLCGNGGETRGQMTENRRQKYLYDHEREAIAKRMRIAEAIERGWTYERIQKELGVGTSTISAVKKMRGDGHRC